MHRIRFHTVRHLFSLFAIAPASAIEFTWNNPLGGVFGDPANWSPGGGPPDSTFDVAVFDLFAVYTVVFTDDYTNGSIQVVSAGVTLELFELSTPNRNFHYTLTGTLGTAANISSVPGSLFPASLTVFGGPPDIGNPTSSISANGVLYIGKDADTSGSLEVGPQFVINGVSTTYVGFSGEGNLFLDGRFVFDGLLPVAVVALLHNDNGVVGAFGTGEAVVKGWWINDEQLAVGLFGDGTLTIEERDGSPTGGVVTSSSGAIASEAGSTGTVTVNAGAWDDSDAIYVGGKASAAGGDGTLEINGPQSRVTVTNALHVWPGGVVGLSGGLLRAGSLVGGGTMNWGTGSVEITGGPLRIDSTTPLGANPSLGPNAFLTVAGALELAQGGPTTLSLSGVSTIDSSSGLIGNALASVGSGAIHLQDPGST